MTIDDVATAATLSQRVHHICCSVGIKRADVCGRPLYIYTCAAAPFVRGSRAADAPLGQTKILPHGIFHRVLAYIRLYNIYIVYGAECPLDAFKVFTSVFVGVCVCEWYT